MKTTIKSPLDMKNQKSPNSSAGMIVHKGILGSEKENLEFFVNKSRSPSQGSIQKSNSLRSCLKSNKTENILINSPEYCKDTSSRAKFKTVLANITNQASMNLADSLEDSCRFYKSRVHVIEPDSIEKLPNRTYDANHHELTALTEESQIPQNQTISIPEVLTLKKKRNGKSKSTATASIFIHDQSDPMSLTHDCNSNRDKQRGFIPIEDKTPIIHAISYAHGRVGGNCPNCQKFSLEKDSIITRLTEEKLAIAEKALSLEKENLNLIKENQELKHCINEQLLKLQFFEEENRGLKSELRTLLENQNRLHPSLARISHLEIENNQLKYTLKNKVEVEIKQLYQEIDELKKENEHLRYIQEKVLLPDHPTQRADFPHDTSVREKLLSKNNPFENNLKGYSSKIEKQSSVASLPPLKESDLEVPNTVNEVTSRKQDKDANKFINSLVNLVKELSPPNYFNGTPQLKDIWKWLQNFLKEYMILKKNFEGQESTCAVVGEIMKLLQVDQESKILTAIQQLMLSNNKTENNNSN